MMLNRRALEASYDAEVRAWLAGSELACRIADEWVRLQREATTEPFQGTALGIFIAQAPHTAAQRELREALSELEEITRDSALRKARL